MTAYDVAAWTDFANTVAGGAAALAQPARERSTTCRRLSRRETPELILHSFIGPKSAANYRLPAPQAAD
jgi:hypothetical protein